MIPSLYEPFRKWSESGGVWLISDPHFDDEDCKLMDANWIDPNDYIKVLNKMIHKNDTLVCLGDCGNIERFKELKCKNLVLIKGNHDDKGNSYYQKTTTKEVYDADKFSKQDVIKIIKEKYPNCKFKITEKYAFHSPFNRYIVYIEQGVFNEVYSGALFIAPQILLSHEPIGGLKFCINIHGHEHNGIYDYTDRENCRHLNIASDVVGYQPISLGKLIKAGIVANLPTIHRLVIDKRK